MFAESLKVKGCCKVADIGTGCGILGVVAARNASRVVATDVNPYAVLCARENAHVNNVADRMSFVQGDMFSPFRVRKEFDLILFNAPYLPSEENENDFWVCSAWNGGGSGREVIDKFVCEAPKYLKPSGEIMLMQSTLSNVEGTLRRFREKGLRAEIIARQDLPFFETIVLIRASGTASTSGSQHHQRKGGFGV